MGTDMLPQIWQLEASPMAHRVASTSKGMVSQFSRADVPNGVPTMGLGEGRREVVLMGSFQKALNGQISLFVTCTPHHSDNPQYTEYIVQSCLDYLSSPFLFY